MSYQQRASPYPPAVGNSSYQQPSSSYGAPPQQGYQQQQSYGGAPQQSYGNSAGYGQQQQYSGGYQQQQQSQQGGPAGVDMHQLQNWFASVDTDRSGQISVLELKQALVNGDYSTFSDETIQMLLNMFDLDRSGTIGFNEFMGLFGYIKEWQGVFKQFDADRSGTIQPHELANALNSFGYNLQPRTIQGLQKKFNPAPVNKFPGGQPQIPGINFDRFVRACVFVRSLTESFGSVDMNRSGFITIGKDQFLDMVLAAP